VVARLTREGSKNNRENTIAGRQRLGYGKTLVSFMNGKGIIDSSVTADNPK